MTILNKLERCVICIIIAMLVIAIGIAIGYALVDIVIIMGEYSTTLTKVVLFLLVSILLGIGFYIIGEDD